MLDIDEIRRANIRLIEKEMGSASIAAVAIGMGLAQYINLRDGAKDSKTGVPRGMRKATAWKIEDGARKPRGWLDADHEEVSVVADDSFSAQVAELTRGLEKAEKETILSVISALIAGLRRQQSEGAPNHSQPGQRRA